MRPRGGRPSAPLRPPADTARNGCCQADQRGNATRVLRRQKVPAQGFAHGARPGANFTLSRIISHRYEFRAFDTFRWLDHYHWRKHPLPLEKPTLPPPMPVIQIPEPSIHGRASAIDFVEYFRVGRQKMSETSDTRQSRWMGGSRNFISKHNYSAT